MKPRTFEGEDIEFDVVGGRTTAIVPSRQKKEIGARRLRRVKSEGLERTGTNRDRELMGMEEKEDIVSGKGKQKEDSEKTPRGSSNNVVESKGQLKRKLELATEEVADTAARPQKRSRRNSSH